MSSTTEREPGTDLEVVQDWTPFLLGDATPEFEDPEQASRDIVMQILAAADVDAVLEGAGTVPCQELVGQPIQIERAKAMKSAHEGGATMFLLMDVVLLETGEQIKVTCGARNVMAQLYRVSQLNGFPLACRIMRAERATAQGFYPLWLKR